MLSILIADLSPSRLSNLAPMVRRYPSCAVLPLAVIALFPVLLLPFEAGAAGQGLLPHRLSLPTAGSCKTGGVGSNDALRREGKVGSIWRRGKQPGWQQRSGVSAVVGSGGREVRPCYSRSAWGLVTVRESMCWATRSHVGLRTAVSSPPRQ